MPDDKIIDIKTRKPPVASEEVIAAAMHLINICDAREIVALVACLLHDVDRIPLLLGAPDTPQVREAIYHCSVGSHHNNVVNHTTEKLSHGCSSQSRDYLTA